MTYFSAQVNQLASWVASSRHVVVYTGAGISTSAGIPDFRLVKIHIQPPTPTFEHIWALIIV